jgi:hypothetical protein
MSKFEKLLDYLVNEEMEKANELFHEIVVEKSRTIYENLIAEEADEEDEEEMDESREEDDEEEMDESREEDDEEEMDESFGDEEESMYEIGGDAADDMLDATVDQDAMPDMGGEEDPAMGGLDGADGNGSAPATKDDILDVKSAIDDLQREFEALLAGEKNEEEGNPDIHGGELDDLDGEEGESEFGDEEGESEFGDEEETNVDDAFVREYRETVAKGNYNTFGKNSEEKVNTKSSINANPSDRPNTKATAKNIAQGNTGEGKMDGTSTNAGPNAKSLAGGVKGKFTDGSTLNVDGKQTKGYDKSAKKSAGEKSVNDKNVLPK